MSNTNTDILLAGAIAAFTVDLLVYPLDTIKTRLQSPDYKRLYTSNNGAVNRSALFRGVYQGLGSVILATLPSSGAFFTTYEGVKSILSQHNPSISSSSSSSGSSPLLPQAVIHSLSSAVAESVSCFILTPAEVLKQNAQMVSTSSASSSAAATSSTIYSRINSNATLQALRRFKRPSQLWSGYGALVARNLPFTAMQFPMFEHLRDRIKKYRSDNHLATGTLLEAGVITAVSAGSAGSVAAVVTTPIDVVKTRIMLAAAAAISSGDTAPASPDSHHPNHYHHQRKAEMQASGNNPILLRQQEKEALQKHHQQRPGAIAIGKEILRSEGMRGLWRGGALRGVWTALGSGLYLGAYESGRVWLGARSSLEGEKIA
ncbi:mitochondrial carrier [Xylona heveae TC161]|uniref:Mitochondrial carrier n=1 Tax=Xylona heveae (strain CBS 132557 / TC161) TaxID=1328760 RepID=A0A165JLW7_XYLHT|nr:mitochondrial carrier [Xylona heveae TC161]KZF26404.1 mitochondrial carrier [Xylona heveae TC161]